MRAIALQNFNLLLVKDDWQKFGASQGQILLRQKIAHALRLQGYAGVGSNVARTNVLGYGEAD